MKLLPRILNRIAFVRAEFTSADECRTEVFMWRSGILSPTGRATAKNALAVLVVCGQGGVTKPEGCQVVARVEADPETFLWSSAGGATSFVRRERLQSVLAVLAAEGCVPVAVYCTDAAADFGQAAGVYARQLGDTLGWRMLVRLTPEASAVAQALVRRLGFQVLGLCLLLLAANAMLAPRLNARRQTLQAALAARERTASGAASADARQRELLARFSAGSGVPRSLLCDRVGGAVPERVVLTALDVEPLTGRFEAGKPMQCRENTVVIRGVAPAAADISAFVQRLSQTGYCRGVRLAGVERERDGDRLSFRIETAL